MDYKTIFIVDPVKPERLQLARFIMQENFTIMGFVSLADCFKKSNPMASDLIIYVLRKGKTELKILNQVQDKSKKINYIFVTQPDGLEVNLEDIKARGFASVFKATNNEKVREITYGLLAPDGLMPRTETPHPVPLP
ncbi:MAG: hypothetical protein E2O41_02125 [Nitrospina sp.]|nr:MAG: hypothetical protein E2O41_02125 [Nitrospina sp.]